MQAIVAQPETEVPAFRHVATPSAPAAGQVLCRTLLLGICGTDREILESRRPMTPPGDDFLVLGHECLARVEAVGAEIQGISEGDLVVPLVRRADSNAPYRADMLAMGQYTERGIVREHGFAQLHWLDEPRYLMPVPRQLGDLAVLTEPVSVAEKAINEALAVQRARLGATIWTDPPPRVLVTGMGPIGFAAVLAARCREWPVTMYGRDAEDTFRAERAQALGATYLRDSAFSDCLADVEQDGFDLVLECTGSDTVLCRVSEGLASRGVMVWLGSSQSPQPRSHNLSLMMRHAILRNHLHLGTVNAAPRDFHDALQHLDQYRRISPRELEALITDRVGPGDALDHYRARRPQGIKTIVQYDA